MNRDERRAVRKRLRLAADEPLDEACIICSFIKIQVVGSREQLYRDKAGRLIELPISHRIEPPYGLRWPVDLERRPPCRNCKGGVVEVINLQTGTRTRSMCQVCYGLGKRLNGDEFAQLCEPCASYVHNWLQARAQAHMEKFYTLGGRLTIATMGELAQMLASGRAPQISTGTAKIGLPGIQR